MKRSQTHHACAVACLVALVALAGCAGTQDTSDALTLPDALLVDADWVAAHHDHAGVRVLELGRKRDGYDGGHIPNAVYVDWLTIIDSAQPERFNVPNPEEMAALLGKLGIGTDTAVVLYDDMNSRLATRMFWSLHYYGHSRARVLDGGKAAWSSAGKDLSTEVPTVEATRYAPAVAAAESKADMAFVLAALDKPEYVIIDGRPTKHYTGEAPGAVFHTGTKHKRLGHIKGAINIPWKGNFNEDGTFKSVAELRAMYEAKGVTGDKIVITYCNEGLHAAPPWFVLSQLLGYRNVRLYDDSMSEWANRDDTPMEKGSR